MSRATIILRSRQDRDKLCRWLWELPDLTRVTLQRPKRSLPQNDLMWSRLTEVAEQRPIHNGVKMTPDLWKSVFMQALGAQIVMMPTLEGDGFFPIGHRSSELSREEMADLLTFMEAWAAQEGVVFADLENTG